MSDRVGYLSGNTVVRDHINWTRVTVEQLSILTSGAPDPTISCTLAQIMALAWRVREFTLDGDANITAVRQKVQAGATIVETDSSIWTIPTVQVPLIIQFPSFGQPVTDAEAAQTESDILYYEDEVQFPSGLHILHSYGFLGRNYENVNVSGHIHRESTTSPDPPVIFDADYSQDSAQQSTEFGIFGSDQIRMAVVYDSGTQLFFPSIEIALAINPGVVRPIGARAGSGFGSGTFTLDPVVADPITFPMQVTAEVGDFATVISVTGTCDLTATATKFWPYANSENLPVYSSTTGAQLRDPFS